jgi:hypothetical protein
MANVPRFHTCSVPRCGRPYVRVNLFIPRSRHDNADIVEKNRAELRRVQHLQPLSVFFTLVSMVPPMHRGKRRRFLVPKIGGERVCGLIHTLDDMQADWDWTRPSEFEALHSLMNDAAVCRYASSLNDGRKCTVEHPAMVGPVHYRMSNPCSFFPFAGSPGLLAAPGSPKFRSTLLPMAPVRKGITDIVGQTPVSASATAPHRGSSGSRGLHA